jgi:hypothetical protein
MIPAAAGLVLSAGSTGQSFSSGSFTKSTALANGAVAQFGSDLEGDSAVTPDLANSQLLLYTPGKYLVTCSISVSAGGAADVLASLFANGVQQAELSTEFTVASSGKVGGTITGILSLGRAQATSGKTTCTLDLRMKPSGTQTITPEYVTLTALRLE